MTEKQYGGFWRRLVAYFIDEIILYFITIILAAIGFLAFGARGDIMNNVMTSEDITQGISAFGLIYVAASLLAGATYFTWFHGMGGRTPGKMLLGLRVIQASGDPMTPGIAFLRWVGYFISGFVFCLGFLWIAFDGRKQGWHDKIAATVVIRDRGNSDRKAQKNVTDKTAGDTTIPATTVFEGSPSVDETISFVPTPDGQQKASSVSDLEPR